MEVVPDLAAWKNYLQPWNNWRQTSRERNMNTRVTLLLRRRLNDILPPMLSMGLSDKSEDLNFVPTRFKNTIRRTDAVLYDNPLPLDSAIIPFVMEFLFLVISKNASLTRFRIYRTTQYHMSFNPFASKRGLFRDRATVFYDQARIIRRAATAFRFSRQVFFRCESSRLTRLSASRLYQFIVLTILKNSTRNNTI